MSRLFTRANLSGPHDSLVVPDTPPSMTECLLGEVHSSTPLSCTSPACVPVRAFALTFRTLEHGAHANLALMSCFRLNPATLRRGFHSGVSAAPGGGQQIGPPCFQCNHAGSRNCCGSIQSSVSLLYPFYYTSNLPCSLPILSLTLPSKPPSPFPPPLI